MGEIAVPSATPSSSSALADLESDLTTKRAELQQMQDKVAEQKDKASALEDKIKSLQTKVMAVQRSANAYEPLSRAMRKQMDQALVLAAQKAEIAEAAVEKDEKLHIDQKIIQFDQALSDQAKIVQYEHATAETANKAAYSADTFLSQKQAEYAELKNLPKVTEALLKELLDLLDEISKAEVESDYVSVYFLALEAKALSERIDVPTVTDYSNMLIDAQDKLEAAKSDAADKKAHAEQISANLADSTQKYETALASRRTDLLSVLKKTEARAA